MQLKHYLEGNGASFRETLEMVNQESLCVWGLRRIVEYDDHPIVHNSH